ncbi:hypothetical protein ccbrp13_41680 [Ktedonobacteria bacterium brp13]|nr:hypothetical protein ccbrp13_41680 [Ktedonobacteria bacterium brp13]
MRYINMQRLEVQDNWPPKAWLERVCKVEEELRKVAEGESRSAIFKKYSKLWSELKEDYRQLSHGKCWYCEVCTDGMRGDMDHHRPKGGVTENPAHPGYWWLAFEWRNFRFSCERCNSLLKDPATRVVGGKQNHFPLVNNDESRRVLDICSYEDLFDEDPLLLDPTNPGDPQLLTFQPDGRPGAAIDEATAPIDHQRVSASIRIYNFGHEVANRKRRIIYVFIRDRIKDHQKHQAMLAMDRTDTAARLGMRSAVEAISQKIASDAEYSSAARAYLDMFRRDEPDWSWIKRLLLTVS